MARLDVKGAVSNYLPQESQGIDVTNDLPALQAKISELFSGKKNLVVRMYETLTGFDDVVRGNEWPVSEASVSVTEDRLKIDGLPQTNVPINQYLMLNDIARVATFDWEGEPALLIVGENEDFNPGSMYYYMVKAR